MVRQSTAGLFAALCVAGCNGGPKGTGGTWSQVWSADASLRFAVEQVCLPAISTDRPVAEFALRPSAIPGSGRSVAFSPGDTTWFAGSGTFIVEQAGRKSCFVRTDAGDVDALRSTVVSILTSETYGLTQGRSGLAGGGRMLRTSYCSDGARPLMVLLSTARPDARNTPAIQLTVNPYDPASARHCQSNGVGEGADRDYDQG